MRQFESSRRRGSKNRNAKSGSVQIAEVWQASRLQCVRHLTAVNRRMVASVDVELFGIAAVNHGGIG